MFAPGVPLVMREFDSTSETLSAFVVSVYLLGFAFGPLVIAPLSELYGRRLVYHVTNVFFLVFTIACAVANSLGSLIGFSLLSRRDGLHACNHRRRYDRRSIPNGRSRYGHGYLGHRSATGTDNRSTHRCLSLPSKGMEVGLLVFDHAGTELPCIILCARTLTRSERAV